jgi:hypothetical protein
MKDPVFGLSYAPSSYGKTVDAGYAFPNALFVCKKGGTKSVASVCGFAPATLPHSTLDDATRALHAHSKDFDAIVIDEFDFLVEDTFRALEKRFSGFKLFGELRKSILTFRNVARDCGTHVWLTSLEKGPKLRDDGTKVRGGPALTGDLPEKVPAMCDLVVRGSRDPLRRPWPGIYRLDVNSTDWVGKDRDNGTPDPAPMNLGEILRLNGYEISRHPSVPWQEQFVEAIATEMIGAGESEDTEIVKKWFAQLLGKGIEPHFARWTVRDAWDRAVLRRAKAARQSSFF